MIKAIQDYHVSLGIVLTIATTTEYATTANVYANPILKETIALFMNVLIRVRTEENV